MGRIHTAVLLADGSNCEMKMKRYIQKFFADESGAISADWVALTAAGMLIAIAIATTVNQSTISAGQTIGNNVAAMATP